MVSCMSFVAIVCLVRLHQQPNKQVSCVFLYASLLYLYYDSRSIDAEIN